jgi:upstream activation factor subunit UAF30
VSEVAVNRLLTDSSTTYQCNTALVFNKAFYRGIGGDECFEKGDFPMRIWDNSDFSPYFALIKKKINAMAKKAVKKAAKKSARKPNAAFMAPLTLSDSLAAVIGSKPVPRTEIIKKIWDYIKKNNLQDSKNRRMINADEKLKVVFAGKKQISMFELAKIVNNHVK